MKKIYFKKIPWNKIPFIDFFFNIVFRPNNHFWHLKIFYWFIYLKGLKKT